MRKIIGAVFILFFVYAAGCVAIPKKSEHVSPESGKQDALPLSVQALDKKGDLLNSMLEKEQLTEKDKKIVSKLLEIHKSIKEISIGQPTETEYRAIIQTISRYVGLMDDAYLSREQEKSHEYWGAISLFSKKREKILDAYMSKNFGGVVDQCIELKSLFGPDALTPEIGLVFALSLAEERMNEEAVIIGERISNDLETSPDLINLRACLAELYIKQGKRGKARFLYEKLSDTLDEQEAVLYSLSKKIDTVNDIPAWLDTSPHQWQPGNELTEGPFFSQLLHKVERLVTECRFGKAKELIIMKNKATLTGPERNALENLMKSVESAEEKYLEEKINIISKKKKAIESAKKLIEEEKFEEAIASLDALAPEQDSHKIKELKERAIENLINRERNRAARVFLKAKQTQNPIDKEKYLRSSYNILSPLIEQYPLSSLNKKIKTHMNRVVEELSRLGKEM